MRSALKSGQICVLALALGVLFVQPGLAQITVLDTAQDAATQAGSPTPNQAEADAGPCGTRPVSIARMSWPSAQLLAEIHARLLEKEFGCQVQVTPGDLTATASSMGSVGQPAVAPELWVNRIAEVWNAGIEAQMVRPSAPSYVDAKFEGWFVPDYVSLVQPGMGDAAGLAAALPVLNGGAKVRFISCPADWACSLINRHLIAAYGLGNMFDVVEPANRFEMDALIAEAVSRKEAIVFYYWQPNAVLAQFSFVALEMGVYNDEAAKCLARVICATPAPTAFPSETVVIALSEWVFTDIPAIASYFQRASLPLAEMNTMLAQLSEPGATVEGVADRFVAERRDRWSVWVGQ